MKQNKGFTLVELMIIVAIIAILAAISYPMYRNYVIRAACDNGKAGLAQADSLMNQYYMKYGKYDNEASQSFPIKQIPDKGSTPDFTVSVSDLTATTYTITATIAGGRLAGYSGALTINEKGEKGVTGSIGPVWTEGCNALSR